MNDLDSIDVFKAFKRKERKEIFNYIRLTFDRDSELSEIRSLRKRQINACKKAGLDVTSQEVLAIIDFRDVEVNVLINTYIGKINNDNLYDSLISNQYLFWTIQEEMRKPFDKENTIKYKSDLSKQSEEVEKRISSLMERIYGTDELKDMGAKVIRMSYEERVKSKADVQ